MTANCWRQMRRFVFGRREVMRWRRIVRSTLPPGGGSCDGDCFLLRTAKAEKEKGVMTTRDKTIP